MRCKVADLIVEVPVAGGLDSRCKEYICDEKFGADIIIRTELYRRDRYNVSLSDETLAYMESAYQFYLELVKFDGFYLHSSAVVRDGKAYLFSGPSGTGKSTHTRLWQSVFGEEAYVINDDKPALRRLDGIWYAYGTPWCGKDGINMNRKVPLAGICFLKQAKENKIRRLDEFEAMHKIMTQTIHRFKDKEHRDAFLSSLDLLIKEVPVYELENLPVSDAAQLSYETMSAGAMELFNDRK